MLTSTATPATSTSASSMANTLAALDLAKNAKKAMTPEKASAILTVILKELPTSDEGRKAIEADLVLLGANASVKAIFGLINRTNALVDPTYAARVTLVDRQLGEARVWAKYNWYVDKFNARFLTPKVEGKGEVGFLVHVVRQVEASIKIFGERDLVKKPLTKDERKLVQLALKNGRALIYALRHPAQDERQKKFNGRPGRRFDNKPKNSVEGKNPDCGQGDELDLADVNSMTIPVSYREPQEILGPKARRAAKKALKKAKIKADRAWERD